jgi:hypothetical protein
MHPLINLHTVYGNDQSFDIPCAELFLELIKVMNCFIGFTDNKIKMFDFHIPLDKRICVMK